MESLTGSGCYCSTMLFSRHVCANECIQRVLLGQDFTGLLVIIAFASVAAAQIVRALVKNYILKLLCWCYKLISGGMFRNKSTECLSLLVVPTHSNHYCFCRCR